MVMQTFFYISAPHSRTHSHTVAEHLHQCVQGDFLGIVGLNPSVSKSNRFRVVIFRFFFINLRYIP